MAALPLLRWSRLGLGTAQFGLPYGVANRTGQVPYPLVLRILERAAGRGITLIDTAPAYGTSEASLGMALRELGLGNAVMVCTKLDLAADYDSRSTGAVLEEVRSVLDSSRRALGLERLPVLQLHVPAHRWWRGGAIWDLLRAQRDAEAIGMIGVSMSGTDVDEARSVLADPSVDVLQIPYNAFDQRWRSSGVLESAAARGVRVIGRSPYLQGLLAMSDGLVPPRLAHALPWKARFRRIADDAGMEPAELAMRYALSAGEIATTVAGVETLEQLETNLRYADRGPLPAETAARIEEELAGVPEAIAAPFLWPREPP